MISTNSFLLNRFYYILVCIKICVSASIVEVKIDQGVLFGKTEETFLKNNYYYSFKGVPYAEPPISEKRFKPPIPLKITKEYEAFENKPTCPQFNSRMRNNEPFGYSGSEDCLYLNILTPMLNGSHPIIVFDYNDNFRTGFNGTDTYSPDFFIEEGVIVVTITHRLGILGYLTTEDDVIPANAGLKDFILGLQWVSNNIEKFGGDPNRVTLMGNRGGAAMIDMLLYSPKAKGLFTAAMLQSGTALEAIFFHEEPKQKAFQMGKVVNITATDSSSLLKELQQIDVQILITNEFEVIDSGLKTYQMSVYPFSPTIEHIHEDAVITISPQNGQIVNDVPILIGLNSREGLDLDTHFIFSPQIVKEVANSTSLHFPIKPGFRFDSNGSIYREAVKEIDQFYLEDGHLHVENILEHAVLIGDSLQNYALDKAAKKVTKQINSPVFYYMFDFRGILNENSEYLSRYSRSSIKNWGATITDELCYLHLCSRIKKNYDTLLKLVSEQHEIKVLKKMVRLWTNFAKTRNPTPSKEDDILKDFFWKPISKNGEDANYLHITKTLKMKINPLGDRANFWDQFLEKYSKMAVDGLVKDENLELFKGDDEIGIESDKRDEL